LLALAGCGGDGGGRKAAAGPLVVGVVTACVGPFAPHYRDTIAGAYLPLLERGASFPPTVGTSETGLSYGGRPLRVALRCSDSTPDGAREDARQLVDDEQAEIILGPAADVEGKIVARFAQNHPRVTVLAGSAANQAATLALRSPGFFRFFPDSAQWTAGLGRAAYDTRGWRSVAVVGADSISGYTQAAGFIAEFCSLGGHVPARLWVPPGTTDFTAFAKRLGEVTADGVFASLGPEALAGLLRAAPQLRALLSGPGGLDAPAAPALPEGAVAASPIPVARRDKRWRTYAQALARAFPTARPAARETLAYYDGMSAILAALESAGPGRDAFRKALAEQRLRTPHGAVRLDRNRNAVAPVYYARARHGRLEPAGTIPEVEQTFGGYFNAGSRPPGRLDPACTKRRPPMWAR
jgi:branched-chain amino acid transport system substrate-binding protein